METSGVAAIVIADDHYNGLGVIRSLGEIGVPVYLILLCKHNQATIIDSSKYVTKTLKVSRDSAEILAAVGSLLDEQRRYAIIPLSDFAAEVIDGNYLRFPQNAAVPHANGGMQTLMNKYRLAELFRGCGLTVPKHEELTLEKPNPWNVFPAIVKPLASVEGRKTDIVTVQNAQELAESIPVLQAKGYKRALIEEYIDGNDAFMAEVLGYVDRTGKPHFSQVIHKLREYPIKNGSTAYAFFEETAEYIDFEALENAVRATHFYGIFDLEFKYADGKAYFIEMNFRNGAPAYAAAKCGFNIAAEWLFDGFETQMPAQTASSKTYLMCEHRDVINMLKGYVAFPKWLCEFTKANKLIWNWKDLRPSRKLYFGVVKASTRRLSHESR